jgi:CDP-glucose 4,6-dehydratase
MAGMNGAFESVYAGKRVLVTGNTGFKGSWLSTWLDALGAEVCGFSQKEVFSDLGFWSKTAVKKQVIGDIRSLEEISRAMADFRPDFVFHLAAQSVVSDSYDYPLKTITTNTIGTANVLEALRIMEFSGVVVVVTSDKCYMNVGQSFGYREGDKLGGDDLYSASKAAAEILSQAYFKSFLRHTNVQMATARAGNVIGGGDFNKNRVVVDAVTSWGDGAPLTLRMPHATRPWQHVLEPLSGYLALGAALKLGRRGVNGNSYNFGPLETNCVSVELLCHRLAEKWAGPALIDTRAQVGGFDEATLLSLNCDRAFADLAWGPTLSFDQMADYTVEWYQTVDSPAAAYSMTQSQIQNYTSAATKIPQPWVSSA